jgi:hypothetical protein
MRGHSRSATLTGMSPKKRKSRKPRTHVQGLSGNPERRAQQLEERRARGADPDRAALRELAYSLAGGASPAAWWRESHERILSRARAVAWPSRLVDLETQAGQIVGDEFYDRLQSPEGGLHPVQWLRALAEETGTALRAELGRGSDDWQRLWALLCGLALTAPGAPAGAESETARLVREMFPDIKDAHEAALAEAGKIARLLARRGLEPSPADPAAGSGPAGEPLAARDAYGSRFLVVAPFSYDGGAPDHWYAWDIDGCWIDVVVGAGVFASAEDALREWRDAVGPAASGAALSPCAAGMTARLLPSALQTGGMADSLEGREPRELIGEYYRLRRRARDLAGSADAGEGPAPFDAGHAGDAFRDWFAARHDDVPMAEAAGIVLGEWGPHESPDERSFYACSPHRIEMAAHLIRAGYPAEYAGPALRLLPEWTEWCIERGGLSEDAAARSRQAASAAVSVVLDGEDKAPFRREE